MPPKRKNTDDGDDQGPPKKKGQAAPHARGGTHRVKVEDLTNTKYDTWNRAQLEAEFRDRRHIYVKDLKKAEIAKRLADDDAKQAEKQKEKDEKRKKEYEARKKNADAEARRKADDDRRRREREAKKARDEEARLERERQIQAGKAQAVQEVESAEESYFSDSDSNSGITVRHESDYASTTPTETSPSTVPESPLFPNARLRMMEWSRSEPDGVPPEVVPPEWRQWRPNVGALRGMKLEYFPMDLVTIFTNERVPMPGMKNPEKIGPDWVPNLTENVKRCARNGVLIGTLAKAQIVRGEIWSQRTVVQYTEGHMYFKLVPRAQNAPNYAVVQRAWKRKYWPKKPRDPKNGHVYERTPEEKARAFKDYREIKQKERFATQVGRPYIGFAPVHLDYPRRHRKKDGARRRDNLFFIKFPGEILPSFHFWTREGEWQDPTRPNPEYANLKRLYEEVDEQQQGVERLLEHKTALFLSKPRTGDGRPYKLDPEYVRIKKRDLSERYTVAGKRPPQGGIYERTVGRIEREIVANGLHSTLLKYRDQWRAEGKSRHWDALSKDFFVLFPGGYMPKVPPMHEENIPSSSWAEKIARLEFPERNRPMSPIRGDEPWTTNDDIWWQAVSKEGYEAERQLAQEANELKAGEEDGAEDDASEDEITQRDPVAFHDAFVDEASESEEEESSGFAAPLVLARRLSTFGRQKLTELDSWIRNVPLASPPWSAVSPRWTATEQSTDRKAWEERFERAAEHLRRRKLIAGHVNETDELSLSCPICAQDWTDTSSNYRALHIHQHDFQDPSQRTRHRTRSSSSSSTSQLRYSIPGRESLGSPTTPPQRSPGSKVQFSPTLVEKRIGYNDKQTTSPQKSSLKKRRIDDPTWKPKAIESPLADDEKSPFLPPFPKVKTDHPDARFDPRREVSSDEEELEYWSKVRTGRKTDKKKNKHVGFAPTPTNVQTGSRSAKNTFIASSPSDRTRETVFVYTSDDNSDDDTYKHDVDRLHGLRVDGKTDYGTPPFSGYKPVEERKATPYIGSFRSDKKDPLTFLEEYETPGVRHHWGRPEAGRKAMRGVKRKLGGLGVDFGPPLSATSTPPAKKRMLSTILEDHEEDDDRNTRWPGVHSNTQHHTLGDDFDDFLDFIMELPNSAEETDKNHDNAVPLPAPELTPPSTPIPDFIPARRWSTALPAQRDRKPSIVYPGTPLLPSFRKKQRTITGRPFVEPLVIAPAIPLTPPSSSLATSRPKQLPSSRSLRAPTVELLTPLELGERGDRSAAPTPSPSVAGTKGQEKGRGCWDTVLGADSHAAKEAEKEKEKAVEKKPTRRQSSILASPRPLVPPNTPALGLTSTPTTAHTSKHKHNIDHQNQNQTNPAPLTKEQLISINRKIFNPQLDRTNRPSWWGKCVLTKEESEAMEAERKEGLRRRREARKRAREREARKREEREKRLVEEGKGVEKVKVVSKKELERKAAREREEKRRVQEVRKRAEEVKRGEGGRVTRSGSKAMGLKIKV